MLPSRVSCHLWYKGSGGERQEAMEMISVWVRFREQKMQGSKGSGHRKTSNDDSES